MRPFKAGPATISGFAIYQFGKIDYVIGEPGYPVKDVDIKALHALDARADLNVGPGKVVRRRALPQRRGRQPGDKYKSPITLAT